MSRTRLVKVQVMDSFEKKFETNLLIFHFWKKKWLCLFRAGNTILFMAVANAAALSAICTPVWHLLGKAGAPS